MLRLHRSAATEEFVLAALLGQPTFAYPTAYGKLEAIYAHSVKDWAHVEFVDGTAPTEEPESRPIAGTPRTEMCRPAV